MALSKAYIMSIYDFATNFLSTFRSTYSSIQVQRYRDWKRTKIMFFDFKTHSEYMIRISVILFIFWNPDKNPYQTFWFQQFLKKANFNIEIF